MTDLLGEALAHYGTGRRWSPKLLTIVAAARNWHTLTNPSDELIERLAAVLGPWLEVPAANHKAAVIVVLDALTDTARDDA